MFIVFLYYFIFDFVFIFLLFRVIDYNINFFLFIVFFFVFSRFLILEYCKSFFLEFFFSCFIFEIILLIGIFFDKNILRRIFDLIGFCFVGSLS